MERKPDAAERLALFELWDSRCAWCRFPLFFNAMEVDHVVAKSLEGSRLREVLQHHDLPATYDVWATENLVPSCRPCNLGKGPRPAPHTPAISQMIKRANAKANDVRKHAERFRDDRALQPHLTALSNATMRDPQSIDVSVEQVSDFIRHVTGLDLRHAAEYRLISRYVTDDVIHYGQTSTSCRRVWLVNPPGKHPVAVVLEGPEDSGAYIQNAAETIAIEVAKKFPAHATVLHYDKEPDTPWGNYWSVVPFIDGVPVFGGRLKDHPEVEDSLRTAGLRG